MSWGRFEETPWELAESLASLLGRVSSPATLPLMLQKPHQWGGNNWCNVCEHLPLGGSSHPCGHRVLQAGGQPALGHPAP